jgi:hypothetical protein
MSKTKVGLEFREQGRDGRFATGSRPVAGPPTINHWASAAQVTDAECKTPSAGRSGKDSEPQRPGLHLSLPRQTAPNADSPLLDPLETSAWFETLPMANVGETARRVYQTLVEFNRVELPDALRAQTVEKFRPPVEYITDNLQRYYVDSGMPLSDKGAKTAALARELQKEMAIAYKAIARRIVAGGGPVGDRTLLATALHHALHYAGLTLLQHALVYSDWPRGQWAEINAIYDYAARGGIHQVEVEAADETGETAAGTVEDQFKRLLLFAGASPHGLRQSQMRLLHARLPAWSGYSNFIAAGDDRSREGFNVDLAADAPPVHNALRTPAADSGVAILSVHRLLERLREELESAPWDNRGGFGKPQMTRPLLHQLMVAWGRPPERRYVRTRLNFELQVVAGLHAIHDNLTASGITPHAAAPAEIRSFAVSSEQQGTGIEWPSGDLENATLAPLDSEPGGVLSGNIDMRVTSRSPLKSSEPETPFSAVGSASPAPSTTSTHRVRTLNESAGGYCIRWAGDRVPRIKIGELIGVESAADPHRYGLGVVRWMRLRSGGELDLGVEAVSTRCQAGQVHEAPTGASRERKPSYKCLLVKGTDPSADNASLVMAAMTLQIGVDLVLTAGGHEQAIRLARLVEVNSAFARYRFEVLGDSEAAHDEADGATTDQFDDLWTNL